MNPRGRRREAGSALGEKLIVWGVMALYGAALFAAFSRSLAAGFGLVGLTLGIGAMVLAYALLRERRLERARVEARLADLEQAALAHGAVIDALFIGRGEGGAPAAFGIAGPAGQLFFARETYGRERARAVAFDQVSAAFARPDGPERFRLEVRSRAADDRSPPAALHLAVDSRDEAERWVGVLKPHLGGRARFVESAGAGGPG